MCRYADGENAAAKMIVKRPAAVCMEKVHELRNFTLLGISIPAP